MQSSKNEDNCICKASKDEYKQKSYITRRSSVGEAVKRTELYCCFIAAATVDCALHKFTLVWIWITRNVSMA